MTDGPFMSMRSPTVRASPGRTATSIFEEMGDAAYFDYFSSIKCHLVAVIQLYSYKRFTDKQGSGG
jgi:hypothetical protein